MVKLDDKNKDIPQLKIRFESKSTNYSLNSIFHLTKDSGKFRPFLLLQYKDMKCHNNKTKKSRKALDSVVADNIMKSTNLNFH